MEMFVTKSSRVNNAHATQESTSMKSFSTLWTIGLIYPQISEVNKEVNIKQLSTAIDNTNRRIVDAGQMSSLDCALPLGIIGRLVDSLDGNAATEVGRVARGADWNG